MPIRDFKYYEDKYRKQGYAGGALWERIIQGSKTANEKVNNSYDIGK